MAKGISGGKYSAKKARRIEAKDLQVGDVSPTGWVIATKPELKKGEYGDEYYEFQMKKGRQRMTYQVGTNTVQNMTRPMSKQSGFSEDYSKYADKHKDIVDYVKKQIGVDLNKYRDGDGTSSYTTTYWDKNGPKVAVDWKRMPMKDRNAIRQLAESYGGGKLVIETGGAWFKYISRG